MSKLNFQKNKVAIGKTPFIVIGPLCTTIKFVLLLLTGQFFMEMLRFHS